MHTTSLPSARGTASRPRATIARRLGVAVVAGLMLVAGAVPAHAAQRWGSPVGNFESATAVPGGVKIRGWAWDPTTTRAVAVDVTAGSARTTATASLSRPDVAKVFPRAGSLRGFETVISLPAGTHRICTTAVDVGSGDDKVFPCRTVTVTDGTAPAPAPAPATRSASTSTSRELTWAPPALSNPTTVDVTSSNRDLVLKAGRDYVVRMPSYPLEAVGGLKINGGRNVVLIGGEIKISKRTSTRDGLRGLYLKGQTGTVHVEGLKITGAALAEGINLDQRNGATVQLQNIRVDTVHGSHGGHHADVIQTWAGPKVLRIDGLTGYTTYQGFFLMPTQYGSAPSVYDLRNVNLVGTSGSKYLMWRDNRSWPIRMQNVWASPSEQGDPRHQFLRTSSAGSWDAVRVGVPSGGDIVPAGLAGTRYVSPGYR